MEDQQNINRFGCLSTRLHEFQENIKLAKIQSLEESAELLRERCLKFHKGCRNYAEGLGEAYDGDIAFASSLETFGGGHNDPISVAFGGPVMTKFTIALREIGTYKEVLHSQDAHKRFDKASLSYDQNTRMHSTCCTA